MRKQQKDDESSSVLESSSSPEELESEKDDDEDYVDGTEEEDASESDESEDYEVRKTRGRPNGRKPNIRKHQKTKKRKNYDSEDGASEEESDASEDYEVRNTRGRPNGRKPNIQKHQKTKKKRKNYDSEDGASEEEEESDASEKVSGRKTRGRPNGRKPNIRTQQNTKKNRKNYDSEDGASEEEASESEVSGQKTRGSRKPKNRKQQNTKKSKNYDDTDEEEESDASIIKEDSDSRRGSRRTSRASAAKKTKTQRNKGKAKQTRGKQRQNGKHESDENQESDSSKDVRASKRNTRKRNTRIKSIEAESSEIEEEEEDVVATRKSKPRRKKQAVSDNESDNDTAGLGTLATFSRQPSQKRESRPKRGASKKKRNKADDSLSRLVTRKTRSKEQKTDQKEESSYDDFSEEEDDIATTPTRRSKKSRSPPKQQQKHNNGRNSNARRKRGTAKKINESESEEELLAPSSEEEAYIAPQKKGRRAAADSSESNSDHLQSSESEEVSNMPPRRSRRLRLQAKTENGYSNTNEQSELSESENEGVVTRSTRRRTPTRKSANKASKKLATYAESDTEDENHMPMITSRKKKTDADSDSDVFTPGPEPNDEESSAAADGSDEGLDKLDSSESDESNINSEGLGDAESTDGGSDEDKPPSQNRNNETIEPRSVALRGEESDSSSSSSDKQQQKRRNGPPKISCGSTVDAVTMEDLPARHVCFYAPDGQARQCFALETLHKIATTSSIRRFRTTLTGQKQTFLQPPHFRTPMSDNLLDQIASRFGRDALDLDGDFYKRSHEKLINAEDSDDGSYHFGMHLADHEQFMERFGNYMASNMGSQDVYACPLCYSEVHRRMVRGNSDSESEHEDEEDDGERPAISTEFRYDPMSILGHLDDDGFEIASLFCFEKVARLKVHLRQDHKVETSVVTGNDLYAGFKIRESDGLLQRYLKSHGSFRQGCMMKYWFEGNNQNYVYLLQQMKRAELCRNVVDSHDEREENDNDFNVAEAYVEKGLLFFDSFASRAPTHWQAIAAPFRKDAGGDIQEFLAKEGEDDEENESLPGMHRQLMMEQQRDEWGSDDDKEYVAHLEKQAENPGSEDEDDGDIREREDPDEAEEEVDNSEEESEEDEWVKNIRRKRTHPSNAAHQQKQGRFKRLRKDQHTNPADGHAGLEDTDEDDDAFSGGNENSGPSIGRPKGRKRLVVAESEEDNSSEDGTPPLTDDRSLVNGETASNPKSEPFVNTFDSSDDNV